MKLIKRLLGLIDAEDHIVSLQGQWHGYYVQYKTQHRIVTALVQEGDRLSGVMVDVDNHSERSLTDSLSGLGLPPEQESQIAEQIREMLPGAGDGAIIVHSELPESSILKGRIEGDNVRFTKHYQGESVYSYEIDDHRVNNYEPGHAVQYDGRLSADGGTITGQWTIHLEDIQGGSISDVFKLQRMDKPK